MGRAIASCFWARPFAFRIGLFLKVRRILAVVFMMAFADAALAQQVPSTSEDPVAEAPVRFGILAFDPRLGLTDFGWDTNVFNSNTNAQRDFTFTLVPGTAMYLRTGRGLFTADGQLELVYFSQFESERSVNSDVFGQYEFRFNRMRPYASASWLDTRQRPGYEIDARARHYERDYHAGTDIRVGSKGTMRVDVRNLDYTFAGDAVFNGRALRQELNRRLRAAEIAWRQQLTVLTTWVTRMSRETERFEFENDRDSGSLRVSTGVELGRLALIRGTAFVGYRALEPAKAGILPGFSGVTADIDVAYTAPTQTRLSAAVDRDIQYSYDSATPYYLQTGWTVTLTQRIIGRWDAELSGGRDRLSYQALRLSDRRTDHVNRYGGSVGYTIGQELRMAFAVQSYYRSSDLLGRQYESIHAGISVTYGY
jgi:hypothetical protein